MSVGSDMRCQACNKYAPDRCTCPPARRAAIAAAKRRYPNPPGIGHTSVRMDIEAKRAAYAEGYEAGRAAAAPPEGKD